MFRYWQEKISERHVCRWLSKRVEVMEVWSAAVSFKPTVLDPEGRVSKLGQFFRVSSCILVKHTVPNEITTLKKERKKKLIQCNCFLRHHSQPVFKFRWREIEARIQSHHDVHHITLLCVHGFFNLSEADGRFRKAGRRGTAFQGEWAGNCNV